MKKFGELKKGDIIYIVPESYNKKGAFWTYPDGKPVYDESMFTPAYVTYMQDFKDGMLLSFRTAYFQHTVFVYKTQSFQTYEIYHPHKYRHGKVYDYHKQIITELYKKENV